MNHGRATPGAGSVEQFTAVSQVGQVVSLDGPLDRGPQKVSRVARCEW